MKKYIWTLIFILNAFCCSAYEGYGISMDGSLKYNKNFTHFDYVNPNAPKGGILKLHATGTTFDSLNPFVIKGIAAEGTGLIFETLCVPSEDEPFSMYGLIADKVIVPDSRKYVEFVINKNARFSDGVSVTADDVIFTFNLLMTKGTPVYKKYYQDVLDVQKINRLKVRFDFVSSGNRELPLIVSQLPVLPEHYYKKVKFEAGLTPPLGSGPYTIESFKQGKYIIYQRNRNYWAKDLPVNKGRYNFDEVSYDYFRDETVALEAFKAGEYDYRLERTAKLWATMYDNGPLVKTGELVKEEIKHENSAGMQGFVFNLRNPLFQDRLVRKALTLAFDFEWINKHLFYGQYKRTLSYFANSMLASSDLPGKEEEKLLFPFRSKLPEDLFKKTFSLPVNNGTGNNRKYLKKALSILKARGFSIQKGKLVSKKTGKPFSFEILLANPAFEKIALVYKNSLKKLGINMIVRRVDTTQYYNRIRTFDYDMIVAVFPQSLSPGNEQRYFFGSRSADIHGSRNFCGIKNSVVDYLIDKIISADTRTKLVNTVKAFDRVLLWNYYVIPHWHLDYYRIAHKKKLVHPKITPKYGTGLFTWWWKK